MQTALKIDKLTKDYTIDFFGTKKKRALDELSLEVYEGEVFGFLGANGAGKTTTIKILMGLIYPTSGTAEILGRPISDISSRRDIGFLPESPYFYDYLTATEFLTYCGNLFRIEKSLLRGRIKELLRLVGLEQAADIQLRKFSKGMLQRIGIAQALINDPKMVFMDEPMSGLDPIGRREVRDIIISLRDRGKTIFFSTHILSDVEVLCDRVAILKQGKLAGCGRLSDLQQQSDTTMEVVAHNVDKEAVEKLGELAVSIRQTASGVNIRIRSEAELERVIQAVHQHKGGIVSVYPVKTLLEDFFIKGEKQSEDGVCGHPNSGS
ncbi:MAG: ABC transporter ATP-binding protein [Acidobacteriota bacterium]|nr:ABC transporter ATP-binding protein [Blastocatellia bacterium]MDW8413605.1 ABC transporter ATP-binding protein [Acidobacteriota bacterium]